MNIKSLFVIASVLALTACASTKPAPVVQTQQTNDRVPPNVFSNPAPVAEPVAEAPLNPPIQDQNTIPQGPQPGTPEHFKYASGDDRVYFGYDQYDLSAQSREVLRAQAQWLQRYPAAILVVGGNADERGTREYNLALGARRADAVKAFLVSQGVAPGRITTVSYGKERPIEPRSNESAWAMNRNAHSAVLVGGNS